MSNDKQISLIESDMWSMLALERDRSMDAVYACAPSQFVPFNECMALAPIETVKAWQAACDAFQQFRLDMLQAGKAYKIADIIYPHDIKHPVEHYI